MPTHYRPTQLRNKRVVFKSLDPVEPKRERRRAIAAFAVVILFVLLEAIYFGTK